MSLLPVTTASPISVNSEVVGSSEPMSSKPSHAALSSLEKCASYTFTCYSTGYALLVRLN
ncbi:hypothetical protein BJX96DRAFT_157414 [Aspergillus floccosus]